MAGTETRRERKKKERERKREPKIDLSSSTSAAPLHTLYILLIHHVNQVSRTRWRRRRRWGEDTSSITCTRYYSFVWLVRACACARDFSPFIIYYIYYKQTISLHNQRHTVIKYLHTNCAHRGTPSSRHRRPSLSVSSSFHAIVCVQDVRCPSWPLFVSISRCTSRAFISLA